MITEIIRYRVAPEHGAAFETAYQKAELILQGSAHCLGYELLRGHEEPDNWVLLLFWDSLAGHEQGFRREPGFADFLQLVKPFFNEIQEMKHYEARPMHWRRAVQK